LVKSDCLVNRRCFHLNLWLYKWFVKRKKKDLRGLFVLGAVHSAGEEILYILEVLGPQRKNLLCFRFYIFCFCKCVLIIIRLGSFISNIVY
jgi:hypothetical protein